MVRLLRGGQCERMKTKAKLSDFPDVKPKDVAFPETIFVAFAVCTKQCRARQFIVDGSTQVCEYCGQNMFRTEVAEYELKKTKSQIGSAARQRSR